MEFVRGHIVDKCSWDLRKQKPVLTVEFIQEYEYDEYIQGLMSTNFQHIDETSQHYFRLDNGHFESRYVRSLMTKTYPYDKDEVVYYGKLIPINRQFAPEVLPPEDIVINQETQKE